MAKNQEIPPTLEPLSDSEDELVRDQLKEVKKPENVEVSSELVAKDDASPSKKAEEATKDGS